MVLGAGFLSAGRRSACSRVCRLLKHRMAAPGALWFRFNGLPTVHTGTLALGGYGIGMVSRPHVVVATKTITFGNVLLSLVLVSCPPPSILQEYS